MGRFKRNSRKRKLKVSGVLPSFEGTITYTSANGYTTYNTATKKTIEVRKDNSRTIRIVKRMFLSLKRRNLFGNFIDTFCDFDKKLIAISDFSFANRVYRDFTYGGHSIMYIGKSFTVPMDKLLGADEIFTTPLGNIALISEFLSKRVKPPRGGHLEFGDVYEAVLKDAYIEKGITETKIPNEMVFSLRFGTVLAIVFYLVTIFFLYVFISPIASIIYTVFNMVVLASFIKICIN